MDIERSPGEFRKDRLKALGSDLRSLREKKGLTLEDVRAKTRMNPRYIKAIEEGEESVIPNGAYYRAFLKTYATFLGLDGAEYSKLYSNLDEAAPEVTRTSRKDRIRRRRNNNLSWIAGILVLAVAAMIFLRKPAPISPPLITDEAGDVTPPTEDEIEETPPEIERQDPSSRETEFRFAVTPFTVVLRTLDEEDGFSWIGVTVDGEKQYEGQLGRGTTMEFHGDDSVIVRAGKPWVVYFEVLDVDVGVGGEMGPAKDISFIYSPPT